MVEFFVAMLGGIWLLVAVTCFTVGPGSQQGS